MSKPQNGRGDLFASGRAAIWLGAKKDDIIVMTIFVGWIALLLIGGCC